MANEQSNAVSIVAILAIIILVGLAAYFIFVAGDDSDLEVDFGLAPAHQVTLTETLTEAA